MSKDLVPSPEEIRKTLEAWPDPATVDYLKYFIIYSYQKNWYTN